MEPREDIRFALIEATTQILIHITKPGTLDEGPGLEDRVKEITTAYKALYQAISKPGG